jgi:hypothetical protein
MNTQNNKNQNSHLENTESNHFLDENWEMIYDKNSDAEWSYMEQNKIDESDSSTVDDGNIIKKKSNFVDSILLALMILCGIYLFASSNFFYKERNFHTFLALCLEFFIIEIAIPINEYIKNKTYMLVERIFIIIRATFYSLAVVACYDLIISRSDFYGYSYLIFSIAVIILLLISFFSNDIIEYFKLKSIREKYNKINLLKSTFSFLIALFLFASSFMIQFAIPNSTVTLTDIKTPDQIRLYKGEIVNGRFERTEEFIDLEKDVIDRIVNDLNDAQITNLKGTKLLDFENKKDTIPSFVLMINYNSNSYGNKGLEYGYLDNMMIIDSTVVIERISMNKVFLFQKVYYDIYPIQLSNETMNIINSYLKY